MRVRNFTLVMAGILVILAQPLAAQMAPAKPDVVRAQISQTQAASAKPVAPAAQAPATPARPAAPAAGGPRRDPFDPLLNRSSNSGAPVPDRLPPGKAGLMIGTLRIDGLVRGPNGMIAVVSSPQQRVYFLREGDRIFDGQVVRITMEAVSFQQTGRDAFGNSLEREITRRLYPNPGEQR
jgi:Tfp pilus assembly protein PilP